MEEDEDSDINSTNNLMDELTFGCSSSSFKKPEVNCINYDTNSNRNEEEKESSEINRITDEYNDIKKISELINNDNINNIQTEKDETNINYKINEDRDSINQSLMNLFKANKKDIRSIHSTKSDLLSIDSNNIFRIDNMLINKNMNKYKNDIISLNTNNNYNETNNETEEENQSLINLFMNKNEIISLKSRGPENNKEYSNLQEMIEDYEIKLKMKEIDKEVSRPGFINLFSKEKKYNNNYNYEKIDKEQNQRNEGEKLFLYNNKGIISKYDNKIIPMKKIDECKYYEILLNTNKNINKKIHYSKLFSKLNKHQK